MLLNDKNERDDYMENQRDREQIDDERELGRIRAQRLKQLKASTVSYSGNLECTSNENELVHMLGITSHLVILFTKLDFKRCQIMREHLIILARKYPFTRFMTIEAELAPFLTFKFKISMLPCLILISDGLLIHKLVGFEGLAGGDDFSTNALEEILSHHGMITPDNDFDDN